VTDPVVLQVDEWAFVFRNLPYLLWGTVLTIQLTIASLVLGFLVGLPAGLIEVYAGRGSHGIVSRIGRTVRRFVSAFGILFRGTPILVILIFVHFVFPFSNLLGYALPLGTAFISSVLALGLRSGAYQSQIFRGAIQSVSEGQMEAARSIGMSRLQAVYHVIVPQALRRSVPSFQNEFTIVLKDTSIVFAIGLSELLTRTYDVFNQEPAVVLEVILVASAIYFVLTVSTNQGLDLVARRFAIPGGESA
jgi:polar amino acid transport system permease protein